MVLTMIRDPKSVVFSFSALQRDHSLEDDEERKISAVRESREPRIAKWRRTLCLGSITSVIVLIINLTMVLWASLRKSEHGQSVLALSNNCDRIKQLSTGVHLLINILSTLLLAASNFAMQCVAAPTRMDVNRSHARGEWLDIGVPSMRNLLRISKMRLLLWLCLVLSSVPLHLLYNSTVYSTFSANEPFIYLANSTFTSLTPADIHSKHRYSDMSSEKRMVGISKSLTRLEPKDCISGYSTDFVSKYGSVVLISPDFHGFPGPGGWVSMELFDMQTIKSPSYYYRGLPYDWACVEGPRTFRMSDDEGARLCSDVQSRVRSGQDWIVEEHKVDYCLVEETPEKCSLEYSLPLAIVVIVANLAKAMLICAVAFLLRGDPLLTVGDAVASFLRSSDGLTVETCLLTRERVSSGARKSGVQGQRYAALAKDSVYEPRPYVAKPKRFWSSLPRVRWASFISVYVLSLAVAISFLGLGLAKMPSTDGIWDSGLATVQSNTIIYNNNWPGDLIPNVLIANVPQLIYSVLYVLANGIFTNMALAGEWNSFSNNRKGLRVSTSPQGNQRTSHFLSLPYRFGLPFIGLTTLLHWLISQSIFLVSVNAYDESVRRYPRSDVMALGYSPLAIIITICVGILLPAGSLLLGSRRFKSGMPIAGSCSLAIAAACLPRAKTDDDDELDIEYRRLKWGAEPCPPDEIGHCAFSDANVTMPMDGVLYR